MGLSEVERTIEYAADARAGQPAAPFLTET